MANKLVVVINSLQVAKNKEEILLYEMKFLVPNYSCFQNPWLGGYLPQISVLSVLNWICWIPAEQNSWVRHWWWTELFKSVVKARMTRQSQLWSQPINLQGTVHTPQFQKLFMSLCCLPEQTLHWTPVLSLHCAVNTMRIVLIVDPGILTLWCGRFLFRTRD